MTKITKLLRTTAFKLSMIYLLAFVAFGGFLISYLTYQGSYIIKEHLTKRISQEIKNLQRHYRKGGLARVKRYIDVHSRRPDASLYLLVDPLGNTITGNVRNLPFEYLNNPDGVPRTLGYNLETLQSTRQRPEEKDETSWFNENNYKRQALVGVFLLPGNFRLAIGQDIGERRRLGKTIRRAIQLGIIVMMILGGITWIYVSRRVLKRIDSISATSKNIMLGDLSQRLEVTGSGDEFDRLAGNLNSMLTRIETSLNGIKSVSDNIAHDLKTPLTRMRNRIETTLRDNNTDPVYYINTLETTLDDAEQLIKIFDALLLISRVEAGSNQHRDDRVDLQNTLSDIHELYGPIAEDDNIEMTCRPHDPCFVSVNRELISQSVSNMVDNALKYGAQTDNLSPKIELWLENIDNRVRLCVADNGPGIGIKDREKVLERFSRLDYSRNKPGSGLGLSLVKAVATFHDGEIIFEDNNPGLIVMLEIPIFNQENKNE